MRSIRRADALAYEHDVSQYDEVPALLRRIVADLGGLDLVIFVAGVTFRPADWINITSRTTAKWSRST
jgi:NAD(P)-dependent dehydrogenase (short-subunit alcohol dehydrogenase family)